MKNHETHCCTFGIQLKNHEKRCGQASSGRRKRPRKRSYQTAAPRHRSAFKKSAKFRQTFSHFFQNIFAILQIYYQNVAIACNYGPKFTNLIFRNFSNLYGKDQNPLDSSQISWDFATNIFENFRR